MKPSYEPSRPAERLYHVTTREDWLQYADFSHYRTCSLESEGFIHLSTAAQLEATLRLHFPGRANLVALVLAQEALARLDLRWEIAAARAGEPFPHLYEPLPVALVVRAVPLPVQPGPALPWAELG